MPSHHPENTRAPGAGSAAPWVLRVGAKLSDAATVDCTGRKSSRIQAWDGKKPAAKKSSGMELDRDAQFTITESQDVATDLSGRQTLGNRALTVTHLNDRGTIIGILTTGIFGTLTPKVGVACENCATATTRADSADGTLRKYLGSNVVITYRQKGGKAGADRNNDGGAGAHELNPYLVTFMRA